MKPTKLVSRVEGPVVGTDMKTYTEAHASEGGATSHADAPTRSLTRGVSRHGSRLTSATATHSS